MWDRFVRNVTSSVWWAFILYLHFLSFYYPLKWLTETHPVWATLYVVLILIAGSWSYYLMFRSGQAIEEAHRLNFKARIFQYLKPPSIFIFSIQQILYQVLFAVVVCAWLSWVLWLKGLAIYDPQGAATLAKFVSFYIWTFFDLIPGLEVWTTLNVTVPLEAKNWIAGAPVLIFKIFVVLVVYASFRDAWERRADARAVRGEQGHGAPTRREGAGG
jgi:hypothetical protein